MRIRQVKTRARAGAAALEMAVMLPLVTLSIIFPVIELSQFGMLSQQMNTAAREGARTAVMDGSSQSAVEERVKKIMGSTTVTTSIASSTWTTAPTGTAITVTLSLPFNNVCWLGKPMLLKGTMIKAAATMSSER